MTDHKNKSDTKVVAFPHSKTHLYNKPPRDLGFSAMSKLLKLSNKNAMGHWCSHCQGIWYSYIFEVECPVCGNRKG